MRGVDVLGRMNECYDDTAVFALLVPRWLIDYVKP